MFEQILNFISFFIIFKADENLSKGKKKKAMLLIILFVFFFFFSCYDRIFLAA